jgi:hypothetical protein
MQGRVAGFGVGPDHRFYLLECLGPKDNSWTLRQQECDWLVHSVGVDGSNLSYLIERQLRSFNLVQPMPDGLLLAGSRCEFTEDMSAANGILVGFEGRLTRTLLLGDGIQKMHSTSDGEIWVSYFDEGVFGNLGWSRPIGGSGLVRFDTQGNRVYEFDPISGLDSIVDCYAMNVATPKETWCYYYTQFSIVQIRDDRVAKYWTCPVSGSSEIAVWRDTVAMPSGYRASNWSLLQLRPNGEANCVETVEYLDASGAILLPNTATCRGDEAWFFHENRVYRSALRDLRL